MAQPFDPDRLVLKGDAYAVADVAARADGDLGLEQRATD